MVGSEWWKRAVFYQIYPRSFADSNGDGIGDLPGIVQRLNYLQDLGVDAIWLSPHYPSPLWDHGYDVSDYLTVAPEYGHMDDFRRLVDGLHERGMHLITDFVLNHTSDQHPWFQAARADRNSPYRDYYVWSDSDQKYKEARIIFIDTEKSNWTWDEQAGQYFWHRFYSSQPDLNYDNPAVQAEMLKVMSFWLDLGIDGFRADAAPYLFEREGTNCENLPETHAYLKQLRRYLDEHYPGRVLLCEANQWPEDVRPYFGDGDEFQLGFHFPAMPRIFKSIAEGQASSLRHPARRGERLAVGLVLEEGCDRGRSDRHDRADPERELDRGRRLDGHDLPDESGWLHPVDGGDIRAGVGDGDVEPAVVTQPVLEILERAIAWDAEEQAVGLRLEQHGGEIESAGVEL